VKLTTKTQGEFMPKGYHHLTYAQRSQICILKERGDSKSRVARSLAVHHSTIGRELKRNKGGKGYRYLQAHEKALSRRSVKASTKIDVEIKAKIEDKLNKQWSPVQISGWIKKHCKDSISHQSIYGYIWKNKKQGGLLYKNLRHQGKKYYKQGKGLSGRGCIPNRVDIDQRPPIVEEKIRLGDWEVDTIIGASHKGVMVSIVERRSKLTKLVKVFNKTAEEVSRAIINQLTPIKSFVHTITADNGKEFSLHAMVSIELSSDFYFAKPYRSPERGLNEHTNGLIRQYFPKTQSLQDISVEEIKRVENLLNNRPRKVLGFETPSEVFDRLSAGMI